MVNTMSWLNLLTAIIILGYAGWLFFHGRKINKWMMMVSALAGLWAFIMYGLFIVDALVWDIMDRETIRNFCIKPAIFVQLCTILAWVIKSGWRNDN